MNNIYLVLVPILLIFLLYALYAVKAYYYCNMSEILPNMYLGNIRNATSCT